jgi:hypothetical protein
VSGIDRSGPPAPYQPPLHIDVVNVSKVTTDRVVAFWVEAVRQQLVEASKDWGITPPGMALCDRSTYVPSQEGSIITIADDDGDPEAAGFHTPWGGIVDIHDSISPSRTLSHEALEMLCNLMLDRWIFGPKQLYYAVELGDPVQRSSYFAKVELFGESSEVELSNYVLPQWFEPKATHGPYDRLHIVPNAFTIAPGGYQVAQTERGEVVFLAHADGAHFPARKLKPSSRTNRIVQRAG